MRRGDIRTALLAALAEGPGHGYEIINRLDEKSGGAWRPSPGSVYPTLQLFEDEGLVRSEEREGKRIYELTDAGRTEAAERAERFGSAPWEPGPGGGPGHEGSRGFRKAGEHLGPALRPLVLAMRQIAVTGDASQLERASEVLQKASKELYRILAED
jgi:DNA-binding PadR family transcriptional regulator